jgi:hypothetical protein
LVSVREKSLGGAIRLGVAREYLDWLPRPEEVFASERGGYLWTTVHLSGTIEQPQSARELFRRFISAGDNFRCRSSIERSRVRLALRWFRELGGF